MNAKAMAFGFVLLTLGVADARGGQDRPAAAARWEYKVLTKQQLLDLGKNDLAAGLNQLGGDGWELAAVDGGYIFKRPRGPARDLEQLKAQLAEAQSDVDAWKDRVAWAARMVKKGFMTEQQLDADRARLTHAEMIYDKLRSELRKITPNPKEPAPAK